MPVALTQTTKQETISAAPLTPALPITGETAGALAGSSLVMALVVMWLRRRLSRDAAQITQDRAEGITVKTLMEVNRALVEENERLKKDAREAWGHRTNDARTIAHLEATNKYLQQELDRLTPAVQIAANALNELHDSGVMPLQPNKPKER